MAKDAVWLTVTPFVSIMMLKSESFGDFKATWVPPPEKLPHALFKNFQPAFVNCP